MKNNFFKRDKGFSLIELVIVVTILAVMAIIGFQTIGTSIIGKSKAQADIANAAILAKAIETAIQDDRLVPSGDITEALADTSATGTVLIGTSTQSGNPTENPAKVYINKIPRLSKATGSFCLVYVDSTKKIQIRAIDAAGTILYPKQDSYSSDANYKVLQ